MLGFFVFGAVNKHDAINHVALQRYESCAAVDSVKCECVCHICQQLLAFEFGFLSCCIDEVKDWHGPVVRLSHENKWIVSVSFWADTGSVNCVTVCRNVCLRHGVIWHGCLLED